jgi:hypothetical protein
MVVDPKTAATFRVLETFQMLSFTSKVSAFEYYRSLSRRTDNTGTCPPPVSNISWYCLVVLMPTLNRTGIMRFSEWSANGDMSDCSNGWAVVTLSLVCVVRKRVSSLFCAQLALFQISIFRQTGKRCHRLTSKWFYYPITKFSFWHKMSGGSIHCSSGLMPIFGWKEWMYQRKNVTRG